MVVPLDCHPTQLLQVLSVYGAALHSDFGLRQSNLSMSWSLAVPQTPFHSALFPAPGQKPQLGPLRRFGINDLGREWQPAAGGRCKTKFGRDAGYCCYLLIEYRDIWRRYGIAFVADVGDDPWLP